MCYNYLLNLNYCPKTRRLFFSSGVMVLVQVLVTTYEAMVVFSLLVVCPIAAPRQPSAETERIFQLCTSIQQCLQNKTKTVVDFVTGLCYYTFQCRRSTTGKNGSVQCELLSQCCTRMFLPVFLSCFLGSSWQQEERSKVDDLRGTPMSVGTLEEIIDDNHAIVSTSVGSEHYVSILSFVDKDLLEPGCSVLLNHKVSWFHKKKQVLVRFLTRLFF